MLRSGGDTARSREGPVRWWADPPYAGVNSTVFTERLASAKLSSRRRPSIDRVLGFDVWRLVAPAQKIEPSPAHAL